MQHLLQVNRKVDYALRAMIHLASLAPGTRERFAEISAKARIPRDFAAKILKTLADAGLVAATRGPRGGVCLARDPAQISFLDVIEAMEGTIRLNVCLEDGGDGCSISPSCTMQAVWRAGQQRMLDVYRSTRLSDLVNRAPVPGAEPAQPRLVQLRVRGAPPAKVRSPVRAGSEGSSGTAIP